MPIPILKVRCLRPDSASGMDLVAVDGARVNAVHIRRDPEQAENAKSGLWPRWLKRLGSMFSDFSFELVRGVSPQEQSASG